MKDRTPAGNSRFAKAGVWYLYVSEWLNYSYVQLMKFSAENPLLRKAANYLIYFKYHQITENE